MAGRRYETPRTSPSAVAATATVATRTTQLYNKSPEETSLHEIECLHIRALSTTIDREAYELPVFVREWPAFIAVTSFRYSALTAPVSMVQESGLLLLWCVVPTVQHEPENKR